MRSFGDSGFGGGVSAEEPRDLPPSAVRGMTMNMWEAAAGRRSWGCVG